MTLETWRLMHANEEGYRPTKFFFFFEGDTVKDRTSNHIPQIEESNEYF